MDIEAGAKSIKVGSRDEAAEVVWRLFGSRGYTNTTGLSGSGAKAALGSKNMTYHWDEVLDATGQVAGHGSRNAHGARRHVQIHNELGEVIRIFFP